MAAMILEPTTDNDLVQRVMSDSDIWDKIQVGNYTPAHLNVKLSDKFIALSAIAKEIIGVHLFKKDQGRVIAHPMLLKPYRKEFGREFFRRGVDWIFENTNYNFIDAEIPSTHLSTINLARNLGFKDSGSKKDGVMYKGSLLDLNLLRLKR